MEDDAITAVVFAVGGTHEYHNGAMIRYNPSGAMLAAGQPVPVGATLIIKMMDFCAILEGTVRSCRFAADSAPYAFILDIRFEDA